MADHPTPGGVYTPIYSNDVYPPRNNPGVIYPSADYTPRSSNASGFYPPPSIYADEVYHQPRSFNDNVYPPPGKSNDGFYPYPPPTDDYLPPRTSVGVYAPPRMSHNGPQAGYPLYGSNNCSVSSRSVATGYPAPPPQEQPRQSTYQQPNYYEHKSSSSSSSQQYVPPVVYTAKGERCGPLLAYLVSIIAVIFMITSALIFIIWLVIRPVPPKIDLKNFSVKDFNVNDTSLTGKWDLTLKVTNPNYLNAIFNPLHAQLFHQSDHLSDTDVPEFKLGKESEKEFRTSFAACNRILERDVLDNIKADWNKEGNLVFNFRMDSEVGFNAGIYKPKKMKLKIFCVNVDVSFTGGKLDSGSIQRPKECKVVV